jgi:hypothetical protein
MQFQRKKDFCLASFFKRRRELLERVARKSARVSRRKSLALLNFEERETSIEKFRVLDRKSTLLGKAEKKKVEKRIIDTRRTNALLMQAWKWADLEDEKNTIKYDKRSRPMKFCVIRTRRRHVVFTFIACVCLEGIGAHIHSKVLVVVLY